ncbi:QRFP-like peptide receptor [Nematostella vectensis]|uniref:QRFP-like peptide receptor n=1 Tax=Nematostella vectensis TaxID=45351 RepID=UPI0020771AB3|nr:QRFP-like peptide receptor [Nematostella vectensis]
MHNNSSSGVQSRTISIVSCIVLSEAMIIVVANTLALAVFLRKTFRIKKSNYLLLNLTVADLLVGLSLIVSETDEVASFKSGVFKTTCTLFNVISTDGSLFSFTGIAIERAYAVLAPLKHRLLGNKPYIIVIFLVWVAASVVNLGVIIILINEQAIGSILVNLKMAVTFISLVVVFLCYLAIWIKVKFDKSLPNGRQAKRSTKLTFTLFIVTLVSLVCYLPTITLVVLHIDWLHKDGTRKLFYPVLVLLYANSFVNFIIYSVRMPEFKKELFKIFRNFLPLCAQSSQEEFPSYLQHMESRGQPSLIMVNMVRSS